MLWLYAAAEVSLTEQKKTGDSVLLFVASSTASQCHLTGKTELHLIYEEGKIN
jgi:hypothetical protein